MIPPHYHLTMVNPKNSSRTAPQPDIGTYLSLQYVTKQQQGLDEVAGDFQWVISQACSCEEGVDEIRDIIVGAERLGMELYLDGAKFNTKVFWPDEEQEAVDDKVLVEGVMLTLLAEPDNLVS